MGKPLRMPAWSLARPLTGRERAAAGTSEAPRQSPSARRRDDVVASALMVASVLPAFGVVWGLGAVVAITPQHHVLAVVLALGLSRATRHVHQSAEFATLALVELPLIALVATATGALETREPWIGQPLIVVLLSAGLAVQHWGGLLARVGRISALPFVALLIVPPPHDAAGRAATFHPIDLLWNALIAVLAAASAVGGGRVRERLVPSLLEVPAPPAGPTGRLDAPTRKAIQVLLSLGVALALGHLLFGAHWAWPMLSAYFVMNGQDTRDDVRGKAIRRVFGAAVGTVLATLVTLHGLPAGNRWLIVLVFVVLFFAILLRNRSYAYWTAGVTAMVALADGYYGTPTAHVLPDRVLGVLLGSALGLAAAWFVVPTRRTPGHEGFSPGA